MDRHGSTSTMCSASTAGLTPCRPSCCRQNYGGWPDGTRPAGPRPPVTTVRVPHRDRVLKELHAAGIGAGIHYPEPIHLTAAFAGLGYAEGAFPVAERTARELLSLPLLPEITAAQQERVVSVLLSVL